MHPARSPHNWRASPLSVARAASHVELKAGQLHQRVSD
jgi:hypothetical protein